MQAEERNGSNDLFFFLYLDQYIALKLLRSMADISRIEHPSHSLAHPKIDYGQKMTLSQLGYANGPMHKSRTLRSSRRIVVGDRNYSSR